MLFRTLSFGLGADCPIDMVLPTGAMGNLTGAYMAKQMGIPIGKLYCGVNINGEKNKIESKVFLSAADTPSNHCVIKQTLRIG